MAIYDQFSFNDGEIVAEIIRWGIEFLFTVKVQVVKQSSYCDFSDEVEEKKKFLHIFSSQLFTNN